MASNSSPQISGGVYEYFLTRSDYSKRTDAGAGCGAARTAEDQHIAHTPPKRPRFVYLRTASQSRVALNAVLANCRDTNHVQLPLANAFGTVPAHGYLSSAPFLTPVDGQAQSTGAPVTGETVCVLPARGLAQRCTATSNSSGLGAGPDEHGRGGPRPREMCATPLARVAPRAAQIAAQRRLSDACLLVRCISVG